MKLQRRPRLSRVKIETSDDFDIEFEDGDAIIVVQADGNVRKLYLPQMDSKYFNRLASFPINDFFEMHPE